jgi:hypothetical protein
MDTSRLLRSLFALNCVFVCAGFSLGNGKIRDSVRLAASNHPLAVENSRSQLSEKQSEFTLGYLNKHHTGLLTEFAKAFSEVGAEQAKQNAWSGASYVIAKSKIVAINPDKLDLEVTIQVRGKSAALIKTVAVDLG